MRDNNPNLPDLSQRKKALSRWENEGGSILCAANTVVPELSNTELMHLRTRVIALENVVIALLTECSARRLDHVREMATYISPRPGFTEHPLTIHAADHIIQLVERAGHFRAMPPL